MSVSKRGPRAPGRVPGQGIPGEGSHPRSPASSLVMISQMLELAIAQVFARAHRYLAIVWLSVRIELEHRATI